MSLPGGETVLHRTDFYKYKYQKIELERCVGKHGHRATRRVPQPLPALRPAFEIRVRAFVVRRAPRGRVTEVQARQPSTQTGCAGKPRLWLLCRYSTCHCTHKQLQYMYLSGSFLSHGLALQYDCTHPDSPGLANSHQQTHNSRHRSTQESSRSPSSPRRSRDRLDAVINNNGRSPSEHVSHMTPTAKRKADCSTSLPGTRRRRRRWAGGRPCRLGA